MPTLPSNLHSIVTANIAVYQAPLTDNSIRIAQLHPGLYSEPISCSFHVTDLSNSEPFEALSYCWGSVVADKGILCNGQTFSPTENLYAALQQLRLTSRVRHIWIDAICINQSSVLERNQQVPLMRQIYQKAKQVVIWLGGEDETTALALATMHNVFESCCSFWYGHASHEEWLTKIENDEEYWQSLRADIVNKVSPRWPDDPKSCANALQAFFRRPWFSRVWVIQEVQGCPHSVMQVGGKTISWNIVASAATWVVYAPAPVTYITEPYKFGGFLHTDLMRRKTFTTMDDVPFLEVLDRCRAFKCTIDKDRIFALLQHPTARSYPAKDNGVCAAKVTYPRGIHTDKNASHFNLKVDYNKTLFDVYRQIVLGSISEGRSLQALSHATEMSKDRAKYPTWMPIWHMRGDTRHTGPRRTFLYAASRDYEPQIYTFMNPMLLGLAGIIVGTVTHTSTKIILSDQKEHPTGEITYGTTLNEMQEVSRLLVRDCWQPEENWLQEAVCRTSTRPNTHFEDFCAFVTERVQQTPGLTLISLHGKWCNICMTRHVASAANSFADVLDILHCEVCFDFDMCRDCRDSGRTCPGQHELYPRLIPGIICQLDEQTRSLLENYKGRGNSKRFDTGTKQSFDGKHFLKLENGFFGLGPDTVRVGDLIVVLFGGRVPFILRQKQSDYTLLGECYIHNMMDGEAIDGWRKGRLKKEVFILA